MAASSISASVAGKEGNPNACAYSASKAGVIGFTKSLGKELATKGILVNAITPATFESPILDQLPQSQIDYMRSKIPMGRLGRPKNAPHGLLAGQRGVLLLHRRDLRHFRRPYHLLIVREYDIGLAALHHGSAASFQAVSCLISYYLLSVYIMRRGQPRHAARTARAAGPGEAR